MLPLTDPILIFAVLALVTLVMPILAGKLRVPDLILLIICGALLGPNGFEVLSRNSAINLFGSVGLLYIMFLAGLEIDLHRFSKSYGASVRFGFLAFAIPQVMATLTGRYLLGLSWIPAVLFACMFATHTLLAYPVASRLGLTRHPAVSVAVGATIITDTLALLVLAIMADTTRGVSLGATFWLQIIAGLGALLALTWWGIPRLTRWFFHHVAESGGGQFMFVLVTVCGCAYFSHFAKMEPIIGAFLAGAAFNQLIPHQSTLRNRIFFVGNTLFIPFFLISVGMLLNPISLLKNPASWYVAGIMVAVALSSKFLAAYVAAWLARIPSDARNVMFGLSVTHAAGTLAVTMVGFELGIFSPEILNGAIAIIAISCPVGAWAVDRYGRRLALATTPREFAREDEQRLLVPVANPVSAAKMLDLAFMLRDPKRPGSIHPVTIVEDLGDVEESVMQGEQLLAACLAHAASAEATVEPAVRVDLNPTDGIIRATRELRANIVLSGWADDQSASAKFFGSVGEHLVENCPTRIFLCRLGEPLNTTKRLVLFFPPISERRRDLVQLLRDIRHLSVQVGAELCVFLTGPAGSEIQKLIEQDRQTTPLQIIHSGAVSEARTKLLDALKPDDLIVLPAERSTSILWTPTLQRLMEMITARYPRNNLILAYPAQPTSPELGILEHPGYSSTPQVIPCEVDHAAAVDSAIEQMARQGFPGQPDLAEEAIRLLRISADAYPVQLTENAVLVHAHCTLLQQPAVLVGLSRSTGPSAESCERTHTLVAILNPADLPPEQHLQTLARIGRLYRNPASLDLLNNASTANQSAALIRDALEC